MTEKTEDFLDQDDQIRGQNYVCLSFISPENIIKNKNLFFMSKFLKNIVKNKELLNEEFIDKIDSKYSDFMFTNKETFEQEFFKKNNFNTTVRGIKVRGVYDTLKEAQVRAKILQRKDKNFSVFVGQVGYWLPWDPTPDSLNNQEYFETELNELVKKYKENQENKQIHFRNNINNIKEESKINLEKNKLNNINIANEMKKTLEVDDPWIQSKNTK